MPKTEINYSNTIFYKITCIDKNIPDVYVGHTTNFIQRKYAHKQSCINEKSKNYSCKLYKVIRSNGGWTNWSMDIINFLNCKDHYEAREKEQEYFVSLNATLNSIEPLKNKCVIKEKETFVCNICKILCNSNKTLDNHNKTIKHLKRKEYYEKNGNDYVTVQKNANNYSCEKCTFKCCKKSNYDKHLLTQKHQDNYISDHNSIIKLTKKYNCICKKEYTHRQGLYAHKKTCLFIDTDNKLNNKDELSTLTTVMIELIKSNTELQKHILEVCKTGNNKTTNK